MAEHEYCIDHDAVVKDLSSGFIGITIHLSRHRDFLARQVQIACRESVQTLPLHVGPLPLLLIIGVIIDIHWGIFFIMNRNDNFITLILSSP